MDFYELLEIDEDASQAEVKEAFRSKVREYHPDLNDDPDAPAQFNALKKAYETLNDSSERNAYDRLGHKDYVAKRIGGFPSGDIWGSGSSDSGESDSSTSRASGSATSSRTTSRSTGSTRSGRTRSSGSSGSSRSSGSSGSSRSSGSSGSSRSSGSSGSTGTSRSSASQSATSKASQRTSRGSSSSTGSTSSSRSAGGSTRSTSTNSGHSADGTRTSPATGTSTGGWTDNALFNWWNGLSLGWPLMLSAVLLYIAGLVQYGLAHESGLSTLADRLRAAGTDTAALQAALVESRHGLTQPATFIAEEGALVTEPPLPTRQWYGALAGLVGVTVLVFALNRAVRARRPYKWVTVNETVGVSLAVAIAAGAYGGLLLAGALVLPLVYLVIIRHTRMAQQFKPTYLYVVGVSAPLVGLVLDAAEAAPMLAVDLLVMLLPLLSVVVLLLSAFVRPKIAARL
ncbi:DnaJ domain-containing protein [Haloarchaeobius iranensis]|uniref:DnaJ domain-containing protein n=2 Tax=Haloarchaeobius iranensis TaxID=996166 RepID=A0A1G9TUP7_9EURY|nr:DnaJ domain-containing protein [Haloarchaeobius iranensis]